MRDVGDYYADEGFDEGVAAKGGGSKVCGLLVCLVFKNVF